MRNLILVTASALALIFAGIAVAHGGFDGANSVKAASATFTATSANDLGTFTCTGADGNTYAATRATYSGTAVGDAADPNLSGPFTFEASSFINTTTNYGTVSGRFEIGSGDTATDAQFTGVYANGTVVGLAQGHGHGDSGGGLLANVSATFSNTGGFTSGLIGGGTAAGSAVSLSNGHCAVAPTPQPDRLKAIGSVSAVSATSITVAGVTCVVGSNLTSQVASVHVGDRVSIECDVANSVNTLDKLSTGGHGGDDGDGGHNGPGNLTSPASSGTFGHLRLSLKKH